MENHIPAEYCKECSFPYKQMGACPLPEYSLLWSFISMIPYVYPILLSLLMLYSRKLAHLKTVTLLGSAYIFGDKVVKNIIRSKKCSIQAPDLCFRAKRALECRAHI